MTLPSPDEGISRRADSGLIDQGKDSANPTHVQAIHRWLNLQTMWTNIDTLESMTEHAPVGMSKEDLRVTVRELKPLGTSRENYDLRGHYVTALADKILREEFEKRFPHGASEEQKNKFWDEDAVIELGRPPSGPYDHFRGFGTHWTRGTLILNGDFGRDENTGHGMKGGKIVVIGPAAIKPLGVGKTGGEIVEEYRSSSPTPKEPEKVYGTSIVDQFGELFPADLARSYIEYRGTRLLGELENARRTLSVIKNLKQPERPGKPPDWVEKGSLDASDWETAQLEHDQWPQEQAEDIRYWKNKIKQLEQEGEKLRANYAEINNGNQQLTDNYARLEVERREKLKDKNDRNEAQTEQIKKGSEEAKSEKEMEGASDIENDLQQLLNIVREGIIQPGRKSVNGWSITLWEPNSPAYTSRNRMTIGFYNGSELSARTPSVVVDVRSSVDNGRSIVVKDWRKAEKLKEVHPYNNRDKARKGKYYSAHLKDGKVSYYKAGNIIDDSEEFPREEILATQEGFGQAQMYELRHLVEEATVDLIGLANA